MSQVSTNENNVEPSASPRRSAPDSAGAESKKLPSGRLNRNYQWLPTLCLLLILASIGYWGHRSEWKIPKFSELSGSAVSQQTDWCEEHSVPESECIACNADLMPKGKLYGWCKEHGVAECVLEHPELIQLRETPVVSEADLERAQRALALKPRTRNDPACKLHLRRIQFPSIAAVDKAGIDIRLVDRGPIIESVAATGEILYDPTRVARLSSRASGTVWRVDASLIRLCGSRRGEKHEPSFNKRKQRRAVGIAPSVCSR